MTRRRRVCATSRSALYREAEAYARGRGIIIADTKFEFGLDPEGQILLIDEALTPDSSRFWPAEAYEPGHSQPSFDKQFVRDYLETLDWDKRPPAPPLPPRSPPPPPTATSKPTGCSRGRSFRICDFRFLIFDLRAGVT